VSVFVAANTINEGGIKPRCGYGGWARARSVSLENHLQGIEFPTTVWLLHDQTSDHRGWAEGTWISAIPKLLLPQTLLRVPIPWPEPYLNRPLGKGIKATLGF
jgi:hypothetical protein